VVRIDDVVADLVIDQLGLAGDDRDLVVELVVSVDLSSRQGVLLFQGLDARPVFYVCR
jgi:hypothetical protein